MAISGTIDFMWRFQNTILPVALAIPTVIEAVALGTYFQENKEAISQKFIEVKQVVVNSFMQREGETPEEFQTRLLKNVLIALGYTLAVGATVVFTVLLPFASLPIYLAIPVSVFGICSVGEMIVNGRSNIEKLGKKLNEVKQFLQTAYVPREGESREESARRIAKNIFYTAVALTTLGMACYGMVFLASYAMHMLSSGSIGAWNAYDLLPEARTAMGAFCWYGAVGIAHGALAYKAWLDGDKKGVALHTTCALLSFAFPLTYLITATPTNPVRIHHSFLGLLLTLTPFTAVQAYGGMVTFDAGLNAFFRQASSMGQFDFQNIFMNNLVLFMATLSIVSGVEFIRKRIFPRTEKEKSPVVSLDKQEDLRKENLRAQMT